MVRISAIAAMDEKRGIGKDNKLLFKIPEDFKRMKELTFGHPIIMGRKTFESIGRVLEGRTNIIITRDATYEVPGAIICHSLEEAVKIAKESPGATEILVFGGGQIFEQAMPLVDKLYLTLVEGDFNADTFFPDYSFFKKIVFEKSGEFDNLKYTFLDLER